MSSRVSDFKSSRTRTEIQLFFFIFTVNKQQNFSGFHQKRWDFHNLINYYHLHLNCYIMLIGWNNKGYVIWFVFSFLKKSDFVWPLGKNFFVFNFFVLLKVLISWQPYKCICFQVMVLLSKSLEPTQLVSVSIQSGSGQMLVTSLRVFSVYSSCITFIYTVLS